MGEPPHGWVLSGREREITATPQRIAESIVRDCGVTCGRSGFKILRPARTLVDYPQVGLE